jgi:hypothetical protein
MITKVFQKDPGTCRKMGMNVLLDSASDQDAKGKRRIVIKEFEGCCDEFLNTLFIDTFVETVDDDEIRIG